MAKLYIGDFGKVGEYYVPTTNFQDHQTTINFDGSRFLQTDDALYLGLHVTSIDGLNEKSTCKMPCNILLKLSTKPYEYEAFTGGQKVKSMVEPSNREKILFHYLTGEDPELNWEKNQGKGGMLMTGEYSNDAAILAGEGNAKKHSRFVIEFDDDIKPFDMSGDSFSLDGISQGTVKSGKGSYKSNGQSEAQKIADRAKAIETLVKERKKLADDADSKALFDATYTCLHEPSFIVHSCLVLGLPIPSGLTHYDV